MLRSTVAAVALCALFSAPAGAADQAAQYGAWIVADMTNSTGTHQCGMSIKGDEGQFFSIKYNHVEGLFLHFNKDGWVFPNGTKARISMNVDNAPGWNLTATGFRNQNDQEFLQFSFDPHEKNPRTGELYFVEFLNLVRNGRVLKIQFLDGNEGIWTAPLAGSDKAVDALLQCVGHDLDASTAQPVSPRSAPPKTPAPAPRYQQM